MSNPSIPETVRCSEGHPYNPDKLLDAQREQTDECPFCNPMTEYEETEWKILEGLNAARETA